MDEQKQNISSTQAYPNLSEVISLINYLKRKFWIVVLVAFLGGVVGVVKAWLQKPKYQSYLSFALEENSGGMSGALSLAAEFGISLGGNGKSIFAGENIIAILTSRNIIEKVLLSTDSTGGQPNTLANIYLSSSGRDKGLKNHSRLGSISFPANQSREKFTYYQDSILYSIYKSITLSELVVSKPDRKLNIYTVSFTSSNEKFSKMFTERLVNMAVSLYTELRSKRSKQALEVLEARVAILRRNTKGALGSMAAISDANLNPATAELNAKIQGGTFDATAYGNAYGELFKNLELARYQYLLDLPLLQVIDEPRLPMKNLKNGRLKTGIIASFLSAFFAGLILIASFYLNQLRRKVGLSNSAVSSS